MGLDGTGQLSQRLTPGVLLILWQSIVVWNLRNAFDRTAVPAWVLFWMSPEDSTVTRERKERKGRYGGRKGGREGGVTWCILSGCS